MKRGDQTDMGGLQESFLTTHWSLIEAVQKGQDRAQALIGLLLERYWKPVYCYLRRKGHNNEEAKDLTQAFFHEIVLNRRLVDRADPSKGRFRSFLLHALDQFLIDQTRRQGAQKRIPKDKLVPLDVADPPVLPPALHDRGPEDCFTYAWKSELLDRTLAQVQAECEQQGLQTHWQLFRDKVLVPTLEDRPSPTMSVLAGQYGIASEATAFNMLLTVKRHFRAALRRNLRNTVVHEDDIDEEWQDILRICGESAQNLG
jgi:RNA polymerase sigma-70 factor (ECF subfamily)